MVRNVIRGERSFDVLEQDVLPELRIGKYYACTDDITKQRGNTSLQWGKTLVFLIRHRIPGSNYSFVTVNEHLLVMYGGTFESRYAGMSACEAVGRALGNEQQVFQFDHTYELFDAIAAVNNQGLDHWLENGSPDLAYD